MPLFDLYLFADYSGARRESVQRRAIRVAAASRRRAPVLLDMRLTRDELVTEFVERLEQAHRAGIRVCFGQDHQYSIPFGLADELLLSRLSWRQALDALRSGSYGHGAPPLGHASTFAARFNAWLVAKGHPPYFYSATKASRYGVPSSNPRPHDGSLYRYAERCRSSVGRGAPQPFNRVGDNGSVGGQTLVGMVSIADLLDRCRARDVPVAIWPFDGLSILDPAYADAHVMVEPYPGAVRAADTARSDESDALAVAAHIRDADLRDELGDLLDLSGLDPESAEVVGFEGWIVSYRPELCRFRAFGKDGSRGQTVPGGKDDAAHGGRLGAAADATDGARRDVEEEGLPMRAGDPEQLRGAGNDTVLDYLRDLSARDEVVDALWAAVSPLGDVRSYSPDLPSFRFVAVATKGIVFGFAIGMSTVGFRLSPELKVRALATGAEECPQAGPDWVSITLFRNDWPEPDLRFWARMAYVCAREATSAESTHQE